MTRVKKSKTVNSRTTAVPPNAKTKGKPKELDNIEENKPSPPSKIGDSAPKSPRASSRARRGASGQKSSTAEVLPPRPRRLVTSTPDDRGVTRPISRGSRHERGIVECSNCGSSEISRGESVVGDGGIELVDAACRGCGRGWEETSKGGFMISVTYLG